MTLSVHDKVFQETRRVFLMCYLCFYYSYVGAMWMSLSVPFSDRNGGWNLQTIVNIEQRSDTGLPNSSPVTASKPLYT